MSDDSMKTIGRYIIEREIGRGGMAVVYQAHDPQLDRAVAIKLIRKGAFAPEQLAMMMERFRREAKALAKLNHPNIVKVLDYGEYQNAPYLVMEYIDGVTLKSLKKPLRLDVAVRLLLPIGEALAYIHDQGLLHRDIKPSNIMLTKDRRVILTDFGIAKWIENDGGQVTLTGTGIGIGTPEYMAPEQGRGQRADGSSDGYSLAVVFYELVTGVKPYQGDTPVDILIKQANDPIPDPRTINPKLPVAVKRFLDRAMAKRPGDRYPTMNDFLRDFKELRLSPVGKPAGQGKESRIRNGDTGTDQIWTRFADDTRTGSSIRLEKSDIRKVRKATVGQSRPSQWSAREKKRTRSVILAVSILMGCIVWVSIRFGFGNPSDVATMTAPALEDSGEGESRPNDAARLTTVAEETNDWESAIATALIRETITFSCQQATELAGFSAETTETAAQEVSIPDHSAATRTAASQRAEASIRETSEFLDRQATELADALSRITETANAAERIRMTKEAAAAGTAETERIRLTELSALAETPEATATESQFAKLRVGDTVEFGRYEQDNNFGNGPEAIEWEVLEIEDGSALIVSRYGLDAKSYHDIYTEITWERCTLRNWLNNDFYDEAFNEAERNQILSTTVINPENSTYGTSGGDSTEDRVFLLSLADARRFYETDRQRVLDATAYAKANDVFISEDNGRTFWWLRTPGQTRLYATGIKSFGTPDYNGVNVQFPQGAIRPAIYLAMDSNQD